MMSIPKHTVLKGIFALGLYLGIVSGSIAGTQMTKDGVKFPDNTEQTTAVPTPVGGNVDQILKSGGSTGKFVWTEMAGGGAPMGMIAMWSGTISNIPTGWVICDGNNGTPNLTDKFIKASSTAGSTGGSNTHTHGHTLEGGAHTLTVDEMPSHRHSVEQASGIGDSVSGFGYSSRQQTTTRYTTNKGGNSSHTHPVSGSINSGSNQPEYYSLLFIMKVAPNATPEEPLGTAIVSATEPTTASLGALWYDTVPNQLKAKIDTEWEIMAGDDCKPPRTKWWFEGPAGNYTWDWDAACRPNYIYLSMTAGGQAGLGNPFSDGAWGNISWKWEIDMNNLSASLGGATTFIVKNGKMGTTTSCKWCRIRIAPEESCFANICSSTETHTAINHKDVFPHLPIIDCDERDNTCKNPNRSSPPGSPFKPLTFFGSSGMGGWGAKYPTNGKDGMVVIEL